MRRSYVATNHDTTHSLSESNRTHVYSIVGEIPWRHRRSGRASAILPVFIFMAGTPDKSHYQHCDAASDGAGKALTDRQLSGGRFTKEV